MPELAPAPGFRAAGECRARPGAGEVHLWRVPLTGQDPSPNLLSSEERARLDGFSQEDDRTRSLTSQVALHRILGGYPGINEVEFTTGPWGKPMLTGGGLEFSLSHSGDYALVAVAADTPVGVDLERHGIPDDLHKSASRIFTPSELAHFGALPSSAQLQFFYLAWTAKEAVLKALGTGNTVESSSLHLLLPAGNPLQIHLHAHDQTVPFQVHGVEIAKGYSAAVASPRHLTTITRFEHAG